MFFAGYLHLKGQRYETHIDFRKIVEDADKEEDPSIKEENILIMKQIDKDLVRTYFPQAEKIERFAKLWGVTKEQLMMDVEDSSIYPKILNNKEIKKYRDEIIQLKRMTKKVLFVFAKVDSEVGYVQGMNSIAAALIYNLLIAKKELEKNKQGVSKEKMFGVAKEDRKLINFETLLPFQINYDEEDCFFIFYGLMKYTNLRKFFM